MSRSAIKAALGGRDVTSIASTRRTRVAARTAKETKAQWLVVSADIGPDLERVVLWRAGKSWSGGSDVGEDGEDAPVSVAMVGDVELGEDVSDVSFDGAVADKEASGDCVVGESLGHEGEDFAFAFGQAVERGVVVLCDERGNDFRVERRASIGDAFGRCEELADFEDAVFQEVAETGVWDEVGDA